ncbi:unnamed protein product [Hymenolepis diminuta]|uniref:Uncharacterized protein n=1 Tax=Hymenolepis diminuta TaxID=6216 RepID=A0A564Y6Q9_HYMDI|nr:unnamed protein product [Hymenolepis diminuta]
MARLSNETRISMLPRKFNKSGHNLYLTYLLPLSPKDLTRFKCINLTIREGEDIHKCTALDLHSTCYAEIRLKILSVLDKNLDVMLPHLVEEYNDFRSLIVDSNMVESNKTRAC